MSETNWNELIVENMEKYGETMKDEIGHAPLGDDWVYERFDDGYGGINGCPFTLWTKKRVYFPVCYDGAEWVGSVPRNPCLEATIHLGGG
jgi:hypothetical protein